MEHLPEDYFDIFATFVRNSPVVSDDLTDTLWDELLHWQGDPKVVRSLLGQVLARNEFEMLTRLQESQHILIGLFNGDQTTAGIEAVCGLLLLWNDIRCFSELTSDFFRTFIVPTIARLFDTKEAYFGPANRLLPRAIKDFPNIAPELFPAYKGSIIDCLRNSLAGASFPGVLYLAGRLTSVLPPEILEEIFRRVDLMLRNPEPVHPYLLGVIFDCFLGKAVRAHPALLPATRELLRQLESEWQRRFPDSFCLHMTLISFQVFIIPLTQEIPESLYRSIMERSPDSYGDEDHDLLQCYAVMINQKVAPSEVITRVLEIVLNCLRDDSTSPNLLRDSYDILTSMIAINCEIAIEFVRASGRALLDRAQSSRLVTEVPAEMFLRAATHGILIDDDVIKTLIQLVPFRKQGLKHLGVVLEALLAIADANSALRFDVAAAVARCFTFVRSRSELARLPPEFIERLEDFFFDVVTELGFDRIGQLLPENWESETAIAKRIQSVLSRSGRRRGFA
jgi:hypothetical protein